MKFSGRKIEREREGDRQTLTHRHRERKRETYRVKELSTLKDIKRYCSSGE